MTLLHKLQPQSVTHKTNQPLTSLGRLPDAFHSFGITIVRHRAVHSSIWGLLGFLSTKQICVADVLAPEIMEGTGDQLLMHLPRQIVLVAMSRLSASPSTVKL